MFAQLYTMSLDLDPKENVTANQLCCGNLKVPQATKLSQMRTVSLDRVDFTLVSYRCIDPKECAFESRLGLEISGFSIWHSGARRQGFSPGTLVSSPQ